MTCLESTIIRLRLFSNLLVHDVFTHRAMMCFVSQVIVFLAEVTERM